MEYASCSAAATARMLKRTAGHRWKLRVSPDDAPEGFFVKTDGEPWFFVKTDGEPWFFVKTDGLSWFFVKTDGLSWFFVKTDGVPGRARRHASACTALEIS